MSLGDEGTRTFVGCDKCRAQSEAASGFVRETSVMIVGVELEVDMYG
jgi:hypothetical protein